MMGSTKKSPTKAGGSGYSAAKAHRQRASTPPEPSEAEASYSPAPSIESPTPTRASSKKKKSNLAKNWNFTHVPPKADDRRKNGRVEGRNLITWTRPRMAEKLLLHLLFECQRRKIDLPLDHTAHRLHPGSTGGAILQHTQRLRANLIAEGHLVPPLLPKPGSSTWLDPEIRGYVRAHEKTNDFTTVRPVRFDEPHDDLRFNLPDAIESFNHRPSTSIKRETEELNSYAESFNTGYSASEHGSSIAATPTIAPLAPPVRDRSSSVATSSKAIIGTKRRGSTARVKKEFPDPADLDSDAEYNPKAKATPKRTRRSARAKKITTYADPGDEDDDIAPGQEDQQHGNNSIGVAAYGQNGDSLATGYNDEQLYDEQQYQREEEEDDSYRGVSEGQNLAGARSFGENFEEGIPDSDAGLFENDSDAELQASPSKKRKTATTRGKNKAGGSSHDSQEGVLPTLPAFKTHTSNQQKTVAQDNDNFVFSDPATGQQMVFSQEEFLRVANNIQAGKAKPAALPAYVTASESSNRKPAKQSKGGSSQSTTVPSHQSFTGNDHHGQFDGSLSFSSSFEPGITDAESYNSAGDAMAFSQEVASPAPLFHSDGLHYPVEEGDGSIPVMDENTIFHFQADLSD